MMTRSLFILKKRSDYSQDPSYSAYGQVATGMFNSAQFVIDELASAGREADLFLAVDGNEIDKAVTNYQPTHVFIEGLWVTPAKMEELMKLKRHAGVKWHIRIHSEIPFIATEGIAFEWLPEYLKLGVTVAPNALRALEQMRWLARKMLGSDELVQYLPNCYPLTTFAPLPTAPIASKETIDIACFGAFRPLKNHLQQAFIALRFAEEQGKQLRFHVNNRQDQGGTQAFKNTKNVIEAAGAELVIHEWEDRTTFLRTLSEMDILMQLSISETFNIVAADATLVGCPILVSKEISWAYPAYGDPQSVADCLATMGLIMRNKRFFINGNRAGLSIFANSARRKWLSYTKETA